MSRQTRVWLFALLALAVAALGPVGWTLYLTLGGAALLAIGVGRRGLGGNAVLALLGLGLLVFVGAGVALARTDAPVVEWIAAGFVFVGLLAFAGLRRSPASSQGLLLMAVVGLFLVAAGPLRSTWTLPALVAAIPVAFVAFFTRAGARPVGPVLVQTAMAAAIAVPLFLLHPLLFETLAEQVDEIDLDLPEPAAVDPADLGPFDLRDMRARKLDATPRMVVHIEEGDRHLWFPHGKPTLYLRGITYDTYRNGLWTSEFPWGPEQHLPAGYERRTPDADTGAELRGMVIHVRDSFQPTSYFVPSEPTVVEGKWFHTNAHGDLRIPDGRFLLRRYRFTSRVPPHDAAVGLQEDAADPTPGYGELFGLEETLRPIADEWTAPHTSALSRVNAVVNRLRSEEFAYSSDPVFMPADVDPTVDFLRRRKKGECTDFASAATLLLRAAGLQARLVAGFMSSEYDPKTNNFRFTGRDAHAWVEVRFASYGWVTFDPTPPTGRFLDATTKAIPIPPVKPEETDAAAAAWDEPVQSYRAEGISGAWVGGGAAGLLAVGAVLALRRRSRAVAERLRREGRAPAELLPCFAEFVKLMRRVGHGIGPTEPIERFASRLPSRYPREAVAALVAVYNRARFGRRPMSADDDAQAKAALNELRRAAASRA